MQSAQAFAVIVTASRRLAIDGENRFLDAGRLRRLFTQCLEPGHEACLKRIGFQEREYTPKNILAGNTVGQVQHFQEEFLLEGGPRRDRGRPAGPSEHGHHRDDHDTDQWMFPIDARTRIFQFIKVANDLIQAHVLSLRHRSSSVSRMPCHGVRYTNQSTRAQVYPDCLKCALALAKHQTIRPKTRGAVALFVPGIRASYLAHRTTADED